MFRKIVVPSSSGSGSPSRTVMVDPEHKGTTILQNISNYSPNNTASHPTDLNIHGHYQFEGAHGGLVVKALRYKPAGRGFNSR